MCQSNFYLKQFYFTLYKFKYVYNLGAMCWFDACIFYDYKIILVDPYVDNINK